MMLVILYDASLQELESILANLVRFLIWLVAKVLTRLFDAKGELEISRLIKYSE